MGREWKKDRNSAERTCVFRSLHFPFLAVSNPCISPAFVNSLHFPTPAIMQMIPCILRSLYFPLLAFSAAPGAEQLVEKGPEERERTGGRFAVRFGACRYLRRRRLQLATIDKRPWRGRIANQCLLQRRQHYSADRAPVPVGALL